VTQESYPHGTEFPLNVSLSKRLLAYATAASAAGVGALALVTAAEAKIVYTRVNKPIGFGVTMLDLNNDGTPDFEFVNGSFTNQGAPCSLGHRRAGKAPDAGTGGTSYYFKLFICSAAAESKQNQIWGSTSWRSQPTAAAVGAGSYIGPKRKFAPGGRLMASDDNGNPGGPWKSALHRYLELKFIISGEVHYGWARLNVSVSTGVHATLTGYAYETIPNKSILTGDIVGPAKPIQDSRKAKESHGVHAVLTTNRAPASLGLLATGAEGLVAWRRKDQDE
jgi:hypothetical protein